MIYTLSFFGRIGFFIIFTLLTKQKVYEGLLAYSMNTGCYLLRLFILFI